MKYRIGIDLGGTNIAVGAVDECNKLLVSLSNPTDTSKPLDLVLDDCVQAVYNLLSLNHIDLAQIESVGIGVPGTANIKTGFMEDANNFIGNKISIIDYFSNKLSVPIFFENDANAAALAESIVGVGKGANSFLMITLGTGIGGAFILNQKIYRGCNFSAGEFGHMVIDRKGPLCTCGRKGCFESLASASALIRTVCNRMQTRKDSILWAQCHNDIRKMDGKIFFSSVKENDLVALEIFHEYLDYLSEGVANLINIFQPEILCIGGGLSKVGEDLRAPLDKLVKEKIYTKSACIQTEIKLARLGNDAGIIGAAILSNLT